MSPGRYVALVTGGNKGLGKETAKGLADQGHTVLLGCRNLQLGEAAAKELASTGNNVSAVQLDVTDLESIQNAAAAVREKHGRLDILVNNAGIARVGDVTFDDLPPASKQTASMMREAYETNVFGVLEVTNAFLPLLEESSWGRIVNVSSSVGSFAEPRYGLATGGGPLFCPYQTSKAALNALTVLYARSLAKADSHVKINAVCPGFCATDLNNHKGVRSAQQGGQVAVKMALIGADGPSGGFFDDDGPVAW